jgi:hypothetical protein
VVHTANGQFAMMVTVTQKRRDKMRSIIQRIREEYEGLREEKEVEGQLGGPKFGVGHT